MPRAILKVSASREKQAETRCLRPLCLGTLLFQLDIALEHGGRLGSCGFVPGVQTAVSVSTGTVAVSLWVSSLEQTRSAAPAVVRMGSVQVAGMAGSVTSVWAKTSSASWAVPAQKTS